MNERVLAKNQTSATPSQAIQASSPPLHQSPSTSGLSESFGSNSNISKGLGGIQPKTIRRSLNWQNISVEAPSRSDGRSSPGGIQRQQEEPGAVMGDRLSGDSVQKSALESSNSTISTEKPAQKPFIARSPLNGRNIPIEAPPRSSASSTSPGGIQRLETSGVKEQQVSTESLQRQPEGAIQAKSSEGEPQEKEGQNKESVQTKLTVGAPGDKYEQEADSMAAKVMRMPDQAIQQPIQRQTAKGREAVQMQPLVNSITPVVQRSSGKEEKVQMKPGAQRASDGSSVASGSVEKRLAGSKGGGSPLPKDVGSFMGSRFGADFSSVRVHTDSNAVQMNKELGAQAFAHGSDIYYGAGKSPGKNELTAHELTHIIQQGGAVPTKSVTQEEKKENKQPAQADAIELTSKDSAQDKDKSISGKDSPQNKSKQANRDEKNNNNNAEDKRCFEAKKKDLAAAEEKVRGIISKSKDTKQVAQHFPAIKEQFKLKKIEWVQLGTPSASIIMEINPKAIIPLSGTPLLLNEGNISHSNKFTQYVTFKTATIGTHQVGQVMEAQKLGPNHPQGGPPSGSSLKDLMKKLPTDPTFSNDQKYIKGHLLNDNLGGPGTDQNLYPITAEANKAHENQVESLVKDWVNKYGYWVYYKVQIEEKEVDLNKQIITADIICEGNPLDSQGQRSRTGAFNTTIHSQHSKAKDQDGSYRSSSSVGTIYSDPNAKKPERDGAFDPKKVQESSAKTETPPGELLADITKIIKENKDILDQLREEDFKIRSSSRSGLTSTRYSYYQNNLETTSQLRKNLLTNPEYRFEDYFEFGEHTTEEKAIPDWNTQITLINKKDKIIQTQLKKALETTLKQLLKEDILKKLLEAL